jgi:hypothetical protein
MTRRKDWVQAYAVVRRDQVPGHQQDPDSSNPPAICGGEFSYTVKEVVMDVEVAVREVARLNAIRSDDTRYFWTGTHLFLDGGSFGEPRERDGD